MLRPNSRIGAGNSPLAARRYTVLRAKPVRATTSRMRNSAMGSFIGVTFLIMFLAVCQSCEYKVSQKVGSSQVPRPLSRSLATVKGCIMCGICTVWKDKRHRFRCPSLAAYGCCLGQSSPVRLGHAPAVIPFQVGPCTLAIMLPCQSSL